MNLTCLYRLCIFLQHTVVMVVILNNSSFQSARYMLNFRNAGIKKTYAWLLLTVMKKTLIYNFGNDFYFQNEEFSL